MKNVLLTGGAGYIGSHTAIELIESGYQVFIVDDLRNTDFSTYDRIKKITSKTPTHILLSNCADSFALSDYIKKNKIDAVIHFAAFKSVPGSFDQPADYFNNNIGTLSTVLMAMKKYGINQIVFSSSAAVYGDITTFPVMENMTLGKPLSPYGYTKQACERMLDYHANYDSFKAISLRYFNPIGAHPSGEIGETKNPQYKDANQGVVPALIRAATNNSEFTIFGGDYNTSDGTCERDYVHVCDVAKAHVRAIQKLDTLVENHSVFNIGIGNALSTWKLVKTFEGVTDKKIAYNFGSRRAGDLPKVWASIDKAKTILHWEPKYTIREALYHAWKWHNNNNK